MNGCCNDELPDPALSNYNRPALNLADLKATVIFLHRPCLFSSYGAGS